MNFRAPMARRGSLLTMLAALFVAVAMAAVTVLPVAATARTSGVNAPGSYTPVTGPTFNRPVGSPAEQMAIFTRLNKTIDSTPRGATIRIAVFSLGAKSTVDRLIAAYHRGVNVKLVLDSHSAAYPEAKRLVNVLGTDQARGSFVVLCARSCRGTAGNMHAKFFLFTRAGQARHVVMVGSNNLTMHNAVDQWSDVYTVVDNVTLMRTFRRVFNEMLPDTPMPEPYRDATIDRYDAQFYPYPRTNMSTDPVYQALSAVHCEGATGGTGDKVVTTDPGTPGDPADPPVTTEQRMTRLRISMHAWNGTRGRYLAQKVAALFQEGCRIRIALGVGTGSAVRDILTTAGVQLSTGTHARIRTHEKYLLLSGWYGDNTASRIVWTGSHNWSNGSLSRDEVIFRIEDGRTLRAYQNNFKDIWVNG